MHCVRETAGPSLDMATFYQTLLHVAAVYYAFLPIIKASRRIIELTVPSQQRPFMRFLESIYPPSQPFYENVGEPIVLSPLIRLGRYNLALGLATVDHETLVSGVQSYAGYLTVDEEYNSNLWFWYFPVREKPVEDTPLILCLPSVPGISSLHAIFTEIGPFNVSASDYGSVINENPLSWNKNYSLLFIDSPVGAGFSFTDNEKGYVTTHSMAAEHLYSALQQFVRLFPASRIAPLVLSGGGLATSHIVSLASLLHARISTSNFTMNLQALMIGSGCIDPGSMMAYSQYAAALGLVDEDETYAMRASELMAQKAIRDGNMEVALKLWINTINVLVYGSKITNIFNYSEDRPKTNHLYVNEIQQTKVRKALNVGNTPLTRLGKPYLKLQNDLISSTKNSLEKILEHYRVLCYSGQLDILMAYPLSVRLYESLHWSESELYRRSVRRIWYHNEQIAGYYKTAGRFTEVMVRAAGHLMSADQPDRVLGLISAFIQGNNLEKDTALEYNFDYEYV